MLDFKIIAVDFDGTLCKNKYPDIGEPNSDLINYLKDQHSVGNKIILWTCREGETLLEAVAWCKRYGIPLDAVNENLPESIAAYGTNPRKIGADTYIDDKNAWAFNLPC